MQDVPSDFSVLTALDDDRIVVTLHGELDMATLPQLRVAVEAARSNGAAGAPILVDLRDLRFLDSMGLEFFIRLADEVDLELVRGPRQVQRLFDVMGLDQLLTFVEPSADAGA